MPTRDDLLSAGIEPSFFNVLAQRAHIRRGPGSIVHYLSNAEFMRDAAIVTAAFGKLARDEYDDPQLEMGFDGTPYNAVLKPCSSFALGIVHHMYMHGYKFEALAGDQMAVKGHFMQIAHQPPAEDGSLKVMQAEADFEIALSEGNGEGLHKLYRQIVCQLPEARSRLQLDA